MRRPDLHTFLAALLTAPRFQFLRYLAVGGWNTVFGVLSYALLYRWLGRQVHYLLLLIPSNILAITNAYACYKLFVFKTRGNILREYVRCYVVYGGTMLLAAALMPVLVEGAGLTPSVANGLCVVLTTLVSYVAHRSFSFRQEPLPDPAQRLTETASPHRSARLAFAAALLAALASHLYSMLQIPLPWLDEIHIVEMGRCVLSGGALSSSFMTEPDGSGYLPFYYIGPALQELSFRFLGVTGPRLSAFLGLLAAAVLYRLWALRRGLPPWLSTGYALALFTHPLLMQSVRLVRIDSWAFALCFLIAYLLSSATAVTAKPLALRFIALGALAGASLFCWPTSFLFSLFYLVEFWAFRANNPYAKTHAVRLALWAALGAALAGACLLLPFMSRLVALISSLGSYFQGRGDAQSPLDLIVLLKGNLVCLLKEVLRAPFFMALAAVGACACFRRPLSLAAFALAVFAGIATGLHTFRFIYLLPFFFIFAESGFRALSNKHPFWARGLLACVLVYGALTSVIAYACMAAVYKGRSLSALTDRLREAVGGEGVRVYSRTLQAYYPGRALGWEHYRYGKDAFVLDDEKYAGLLPRVDVVIDSVTWPHYAIEESYTLYGLIRDFLIRSARPQGSAVDANAAHGPGGHAGLRGRFAQAGKAMAFNATPAAERSRFEQKLLSLGFRKTGALDLTVPLDRYPPCQRRLLSRLATNPDFDTLIIWRRTDATRQEPAQ